MNPLKRSLEPYEGQPSQANRPFQALEAAEALETLRSSETFQRVVTNATPPSFTPHLPPPSFNATIQSQVHPHLRH